MISSGKKFSAPMAPGATAIQVLPSNPKRRTLIIGIGAGGPSFIAFGDNNFSTANAEGIALRPEAGNVILKYDDIGDDLRQTIWGFGQATDVVRGIEYTDA